MGFAQSSALSSPVSPAGSAGWRLWPGVAAVALQWALRYALPVALPDAMIVAVMGAFVLGIVVLVWWIFFSRIPKVERWGGLAMIAVGMTAATLLAHPSIAKGMMGLMLAIYSVPVVSLALVGWALVARGLADGTRRAALAAAILLACGVWTALRTEGITGMAVSDFRWRWTPSAEEKLLAKAGTDPVPAVAAEPVKPAASEKQAEVPKDATPAAAPAATEKAVTVPAKIPAGEAPAPVDKVEPVVAIGGEWPGFRGAARDGVIRGVRIKTDWAATPPVEMWRREVGPGWSSFAVRGGLAYTQEQRGEFEMVTCYRLANGEPVWVHKDAARFWESNAGAGPRSTPTIQGGRVFTFGATGILNALNAGNGKVIWTRNVATDTGVKIPGWGFSSSPVVAQGAVIVSAYGRLAAYDASTGSPRWEAKTGGASYGSPHLVTLGGTEQVVLLHGLGATSVSPTDGKVLWQHSWEGGGASILQPAFTGDGDLLLTNSGPNGGGLGTRRLLVKPGGGPADEWVTEARWTSQGLKPYFNDLVVHKGNAFGFDGSILSCIELGEGKRMWKGGRYGHGQMILLREQDLLLVLSEEGELALVGATGGQFSEVTKFRAMDGKTWNHPVLLEGGVLLARNGQEMVAFRLPLAER